MPDDIHQPHNQSVPQSIEIQRILDANFNRASEGLRVAEEILRLGRNDTVLSLRAKQIRHVLADISKQCSAPKLLMSRDIRGDVGTLHQTQPEYSRQSIDELLTANLKRSQQSLRVIEECLKFESASLAAAVESLRYEVYQLEFAAESSCQGRSQLQDVRLYVLVEGESNEQRFEELCAEIISAGVDWIQLRDKSLSDRELLSRGSILRRLTHGTKTRWLMNDRADLAWLAGASGVHLGQDDLSVAEARRIVGPDLLIGVSTHDFGQAESAVRDGANYLGVGPVFASTTKNFEQLKGTQWITEVSDRIALPWFAIGGIDLHNLSKVLESGATRVAVGHAITRAAKPGQAVEAFRHGLRNARRSEAQPRSPV